MTLSLSQDLERRLTQIAENRNTTVEALLAEYVTSEENGTRDLSITRTDDLQAIEQQAHELNEHRTRLRGILDSQIDLVCRYTPETILTYVNDAYCTYFGKSREELLGTSFMPLGTPDQLEEINARIAQLEQDASPNFRIFQSYNAAGEVRWIQWVDVGITDEHGEVIEIQAVGRDVTALKNAQEAIQESEEKYRNLVETSHDLIWSVDTEGRIAFINQAAKEIYGYEPEELIGTYYLDLAPEDQREANIASWGIATQQGDRLFDYENWVVDKTGKRVLLSTNSIILRDEDGNIIGSIGTSRDITHRKQLEAELFESEARLRRAVEDAPVPMAIHAEDGEILHISQAWLDITGYTQEQLRSIDDWVRLAYGVKEREVKNVIDHLFELDKRVNEGEFTVTCADGSERIWDFYSTPLGKQADGRRLVLSVGVDITERHSAKANLQKQREMLDTMFRNIPVMLAQFDENGQFEYVNQYWVEVLGWTMKDMKDHPDIMAEFYPAPDYRQQVIEFMLSGETHWRDFVTRTRDGKLIDTSWTNVQLQDGRSIGIGQVITQRKELERQQLYAQELELQLEKEREIQALKDRFLWFMTHEFRTPLSVISTSIHLITEYIDRLSQEKILQKLQQMQDMGTQMVNLMEDVLLLSKGQAGKTDISREPVELKHFCDEIADMLRSTDVDSHEIIVKGDSGVANIDRHLIDHVLSNLLSNALKYSPEGSPITVTTIAQDAHWQIIVEDQGIGIPKDELPDLFEPFFRASNSRRISGTGLGLSIVKEYIHLHRGTIQVESDVNQGAKFTITLPV